MAVGSAIRTVGQNLRRRFWQDDAPLRTRLINIGHLLSGSLAATFVGVLGFIITARALGPVDYGILALTYSYVRIVGSLIAFQSWQPLIKYGAELRGEEHVDEYRSLLKFGFAVDLLAAATSYIAAVTLALAFGPLFGIGEDGMSYVLVFSTVLLFQVTGVPTAVLRLAGRFGVVAYSAALNGALRTLLCAVGLVAGADLFYFVVVWALTQITGTLVLLFLTFQELDRQNVRRIAQARLTGVRDRFKGLLGFTIGGNLELTIRSSANEFDTLIVGALSDPASAGLYHIAKRLARLVLQLGVHVQAVLYPDVARLWAAHALEDFRRTIFQMEVLLAAFGIACLVATVVAGRPFLILTIGPEFGAAASLAMVQMLAVALQLSGSAMRTALLAMGRQPTVLKIVLISTGAFHLSALALVPQLGPIGANIAHVIMACIWLAALMVSFRSALRGAMTAGLPESVPG